MKVWLPSLLALCLSIFFLIGCDGSHESRDFEVVIPEVERSAEPYIKAVHWFGDGWPVNFWNTDLEAVARADFERIRDDGFNTVVFLVPWPGFAPDATSGTLDEERLSRLQNLMMLAHELGLMSILRVSYAWDALDESSGPRLRSLWLDDDVYQGWLGYLDSLWQALGDTPGFQFGFFSWEDLWAIISVADADLDERLAVSQQLGFDAWVRSRYTEDELAGVYAFSSGPLMPIPHRRERSFALFLEYVNEAWIERYFLPAQEKFPELSMEIRIDSDPIFDGDRLVEWFQHSKAWHLPGARWVTLYWSPAMGGQNVGEQLTPEQAAFRLNEWLQRVAEHAGPKNIFIGQFLAEDFTPGYEMNGKLARDQVDEFLQLATPVLNARAAGVGLWTWRDYAHDAVANPQFFKGLEGWYANSEDVLTDHGVLLSATDELHFSTQLYEYHAPGGPTKATLCVTAKSMTDYATKLAIYQAVGQVRSQVAEFAFSESPITQCVEHDTHGLYFELLPDTHVMIEEINSIGFIQISGMRSLGRDLKPVASAYQALNSQLKHRPRLTIQKYPDGWIGEFWVEQLTIPPSRVTLILRTHLPDDWPVTPNVSISLNGENQGDFPCVAQGEYFLDVSHLEMEGGVIDVYAEADVTHSPIGDERSLGCVMNMEWLPPSGESSIP